MWRPGVRSIRRVGEPGLGAVYEQRVAGPGGRDVAADIRVTGYEPDRRVGFDAIAGPVRPHGEYRFEHEGDGTRVSLDLSADLSGAKAVLLAGMVQRSMDSEVAALARAKEHLERR